MKKALCVAIGFILAAWVPVHADQDDDTLRFYLAKSDLVVSGEILKSKWLLPEARR